MHQVAKAFFHLRISLREDLFALSIVRAIRPLPPSMHTPSALYQHTIIKATISSSRARLSLAPILPSPRLPSIQLSLLRSLPGPGSLFLHKPYKLIHAPGPSPLLAPPPHALILPALLHKHPHLLPHILTNPPLPPLLQILNPPLQPGRCGGTPGDTGGLEEEAPVLDCDF